MNKRILNQMSQDEIKEAVREKYSKVTREPTGVTSLESVGIFVDSSATDLETYAGYTIEVRNNLM